MHRLMVRCPATNDVSFTGLIMDEESFSRCDFLTDRAPQVCPFCDDVHSYKSADFFLEEYDQKDGSGAAAA
jgi:hypothetical protein